MCVCVVAASMNNLNDPPRWNIQPDPRGRGAGASDGNQWNYALLVPMLGLAAFLDTITIVTLLTQSKLLQLVGSGPGNLRGRSRMSKLNMRRMCL
ncbi:hypothetical protein INR49_012864 [Caranx melampygus]|nr:hypothetical protein INR49_012864 [Caranx melampygus]